MNEPNKYILRKALDKLPVYPPDDNIWERIQNRLAKEELHRTIADLKSYDPPEELWDQITRELGKNEGLQQSTNTRVQAPTSVLRRMYTYAGWAAAAVVAGILVYFTLFGPSGSIDVRFTTETVPGQINLNDSGDEIYDALLQVCAANPAACSGKDFQRKKEELDYLLKQEALIRQRISPYRDNKDLQLMLTKIELEKAAIVKQIISNAI